ncbi:hypothetical protein [Plesiomonas shigelloides]|uniref:hypothetical protein n=1 Tax=Plesiomonas shigelloides TaxID=703 RepID=UPI001261D93B|nr:hypothetical protein [Plesiomonas shigelloides]KAB7669741.1 hypothetical protein GBN18_06095 [Plesiomonas shigelloides]
MERHDIEFDIAYSYHLESMFSTITGRIDRLITLIIIVAGFSVFSSISGYAWFGILIAVLSVAQIVYQFARVSGVSENQAGKYLSLSVDSSELSDTELKARFKELQKSDSKAWGVLTHVAYKRACIVLGREDTTAKLTVIESCAAWLAGDLPKESKSA